MPSARPPLLRLADPSDFAAMVQCDAYAQSHQPRRTFIREALVQQQCQVAVVGGKVVGFVVLTDNFFERNFVALVAVADAHRRKGIAFALLSAAEHLCRTTQLFSSTNQSNAAAQALLLKAGFVRSGLIENLDARDPELIFCKPVHQQTR